MAHHEAAGGPTVPPLDPKYLDQISQGLDRAFQKADEETAEIDELRIAIVSDHHKGAQNKADDFRRCEFAYAAALGYYLESGYRLCILGDAEELWEESPADVLDAYTEVLRLERKFREAGRYDRFWGNHDDLWGRSGEVRKLNDVLSQGPMREALKIRIRRPAGSDCTIFLVHGHQGTTESDKWGWLSKPVVRLVWRQVQRVTGWSATTPASDHRLRGVHDRAMYEWARRRGPGVIMIAGHTHRPVFARSMPDPPPARSVKELEDLHAKAGRNGDGTAAAALRAELEYSRTLARRPDPVAVADLPCYFNTGCCSFPDGDITGLEIADGELRLVRWPVNLGELRDEGDQAAPGGTIDAERRILATQPLTDLLDTVSSPRPGPTELVEHVIVPAAPEPTAPIEER
jgi:UDP-2,3-diacylglucosamine pyrophosphatase LpxH